MPILYRACDTCDHRFELLQHGPPPLWLVEQDAEWDGHCPECGSREIRRKIAPPADDVYARTNYPFWCKTLKAYVESPAHQRALAKAQGLRVSGHDGLDDAIRDLEREEAERAEIKRRNDEAQAELERDPEFQRARASGIFEDLMRRHHEERRRG